MNVALTPAPHLACAVVTDAAELAALAPAWRELLARSASDEAMLTPEWLLSWWEVFGPLGGRRLCCLACRDEAGRLVGLAPLLRRRHWYPPGIPFRRIEALASGEREADSICSDYLNAIAERGREAAVAGALARALAAEALGAWDELVLPMMNGDGPMPGLLADALRGVGLHAELTTTGAAPYLTLPASWDAYLKGLDKKDRYNVVRAQRDFEQWAGGEARVERVAGPADLERGKRVLVELHRQRWQPEAAGGTFRSPRFLAFHDRVLPRLLAAGALELLWLSVRGEPVAAMYNVVWGNKVSFYQCGRRLDVPKHVRPGSVLLAQALRAAIEAGRREFDFLGGVAPYKMQLTRTTRPLVRLRAARPGLLEQARRLARAGRGVARRLRRALVPLPAETRRSIPPQA
jgi:CelD/BcsL family acetyltransferase involved in cellulose biosynthesis